MSCRGLGWQIGRGARAPKGKEKGGIESASRTHLDVHGLLVGLELAALGCLVLLGVPLAGHLGLLAVAAAHGCWWLFLLCSGCEGDKGFVASFGCGAVRSGVGKGE